MLEAEKTFADTAFVIFLTIILQQMTIDYIEGLSYCPVFVKYCI